MVIGINDSLLEEVKKEILDTLQTTESRVVDIFDFGETQGSDEVLGQLSIAGNALLMIGEKNAAALCETIKNTISQSLTNQQIDDEKNDKLAAAFLALTQYIKDLSATEKPSIELGKVRALLQGEGVVYQVEEQQRALLLQVVNKLSKIRSTTAANTYWQYLYKLTKVAKDHVSTHENYEYIWLVQQLAMLNVKHELTTDDASADNVVKTLAAYLQHICQSGEAVEGYHKVSAQITALTKQVGGEDSLRSDFSPPMQRLVFDDNLGIVFPISSKTIEAIAFLIKKELAVTRNLFEEALTENTLNTPKTKQTLAETLKPSKAAFDLLAFDAASYLIGEIETLLQQADFDTAAAEHFTRNIVLVEDALWQLDYLGLGHVVKSGELVQQQQQRHARNIAVNATKIKTASTAYQFFKQARDQLIEHFSDSTQMNMMRLAGQVHKVKSTCELLSETALVTQLQKTEQAHLFLAAQTDVLKKAGVNKTYLDLLVTYEIIFEQLQNTIDIDSRALKLLDSAQKSFIAAISLSPERMANPDYMDYGTQGHSVADDFDTEETTEVPDAPAIDDADLDIPVAPESNTTDTASETVADNGDDELFERITAESNLSLNEEVASVSSDEVDEEILEIFTEESQGIAEQLEQDLPKLKNDYFNKDLIGDLRRAFHTLKGSGRMVGLNVFGEFAWQHEELLNRVIAGEIEITDIAHKQLCNASELVRATVFSTPIEEDREALLTAAAKAEAIKKALLDPSTIPAAPAVAESAETSKTDAQMDASPADTAESSQSSGDQTEAEHADKTITGEALASALSNEDLIDALPDEAVSHLAQRLGAVSPSAKNAEQVVSDIAEHPALTGESDASAEPLSASEQALQHYVQESEPKIAASKQNFSDWEEDSYQRNQPFNDLKSNIDSITADGETVKHADNRLATSTLSDTLAQMADSEVDIQPAHAEPVKSAIDDLSRMHGEIADGKPGYANTRILQDLAGVGATMQSEQGAEIASETATDGALQDYVRDSEPKIAASKQNYAEWETDSYQRNQPFNDLKGNIDSIAAEGESISHADNRLATSTLSGTMNQMAGSELEIEQSHAEPVKSALDDLSRMHQEIAEGKPGEVDTQVLQDLVKVGVAMKEGVSSGEDSATMQVASGWHVGSGGHGVATDTESSATHMAGATAYLGESGDLTEKVNDLRRQFSPSNLLSGNFQHDNLIESIYDLEASIDAKDTPAWAWEFLSSMESAISSMRQKSLTPSASDYQKIAEALKAIESSAEISDKEAKKINNDLMGIRANLATREARAHKAQEFSDNAHDHLAATDMSFNDWQKTGYRPDDSLSGLIEQIDNVRQDADRAEYNDIENLSSMVKNILSRIQTEDVIPFDPVVDTVEEAIGKIMAAEAKMHGDGVEDSLLSDLSRYVNAPQIGSVFAPSMASQIEFTDSEPTENMAAYDLDNQVVSGAPAYNSFAFEADPYVSASREHFDNWEQTGFSDEAPLEKLSGSVKNITDLSEKHNFDSAAQLGNTVSDILDRLYDGVMTPSAETAETVSDAISEFDRATQAIVQDSGEKDISSNLISAVQAVSTMSNIGQPVNLDLNAAEYSVAAQQHQAVQGGISKSKQAGASHGHGSMALSPTPASAPIADAPMDENAFSEEIGGQAITSMFQQFAADAEPHIEASKEHFSDWEESGFERHEPLGRLTDSVQDITDVSQKHQFKSATDLGLSVGDVLKRLKSEKVKPHPETSEHVGSALDEFERSAQSAKSGDGDPEISQSVVQTAQGLASADDIGVLGTSAIEEMEESAVSTDADSLSADTKSSDAVASKPAVASEPSEADKSAAEKSKESPYLPYIQSARSHIDASKDHFDEWQEGDFTHDECREKLTDNINNITDLSEKHEYKSGAELGHLVSKILDRVADEGIKPDQSTVETIESAVNEFDRSATAISTNSGQQEISSDILQNVSLTAETKVLGAADTDSTTVASAVSGVATSAEVSKVAPGEAGEATESPYLPYIQSARSHIDASKDHFDEWQEGDFTHDEHREKLADNINNITDLSEKYEYESGAELGHLVSKILDRVADEGIKPDQSTVETIESAVNEFDRSATAISTNSGQQEINPDILQNVSLTAETKVLGTIGAETVATTDSEQQVTSRVQTDNVASEKVADAVADADTADKRTESSDTKATKTATASESAQANEATSGKATESPYLPYVQSARSHIDASKDHFDEWQEGDFIHDEHREKLTDNINDITDLSEKYEYKSGSELGHLVGKILNRVADEGIKPNQSTVETIENAVNEFDRSATAISSNSGQQEINPDILQNVSVTAETEVLGATLDSSLAAHELFAEDHRKEKKSTFKDEILGHDKPDDSSSTKVSIDAPMVEMELPEDAYTSPASTQSETDVRFNDPNKLDSTILDIFLDEAQDIVQRNNKNINDWKADYADLSALQEVQRGMHTLKGGARMAELTVLGDLSHHMETLLGFITDGQVEDKDGAYDILSKGLSLSADMVQQADAQQLVYESPDYLESLDSFVKEQTGKSIGYERKKATAKPPQAQKSMATPQPQTPSMPSTAATDPAEMQKRRSYTLRVRSELMDKLSGLVGEDSIARARLERNTLEHGFQLDELSRTIIRVGEQLRRLENETEAQILFRHETETDISHDFDPLELDRFSEIQQLSRLLSESMDDLQNLRVSLSGFVDENRQILTDQNNIQRELQDSILSASLVRFDSIKARIETMVNQVARDMNKEVEVQIYGGQIEIERNMLEDLIPGFEHTIRNSVAHGIELPDDRKRSGKPHKGRIRVGARREGSEIWFIIADDGRGANLAAIRDKAKKLGILDEARAEDRDYLLQLLFEPGFTTAKSATQIFGRGIGLDVLKDVVNARRGSIEVETEENKGMATSIRMPFSMSITDALPIQVGKYVYAVPIMSVEGIARIPNDLYEPFSLGQTTYYSYGQNRYKLESLTDFIDPHAEKVPSPHGIPALLVRIGGRRIAFEVSEISNRQEIIIKSVNHQFTSLPGVIGAAVLNDGHPVPVLEIATLGRHFLSFQETGQDIRDRIELVQRKDEEVKTRILVVDDSITMRKVTTKILDKYDVESNTAKDGLDAIDVVNDWIPDLILLDIEMPRMDGFEFATHIRNHEVTNDIPIIMITSRTGSKHRERADSIGVNDYLGKPYTEEVLVNAIENVLEVKLEK